MAPKVTSSRDRNKGKAKTPVRSDKGRPNRQSASTARVSTGSNGKPRAGGARVTNAAQRTNTGSARVTQSQRDAALPALAPRSSSQRNSPRPGGRVVVDESPRLPGGRGALATSGNGRPSSTRPSGGPVQQVNVRDLGGRPQRSLPAGRPGGGLTDPKPSGRGGGSSRPALPPGNRGGGLTAPKPTAGNAPKPSGGNAPKPSGGGVRGLLPGRAPISLGGLRGGLIGLVGGIAADRLGRTAGEAIGTFMRNESNKPKDDKRSNRPGGRSRPSPGRQGATAANYENLYDTGAGRGNYGLDRTPPAAPKSPAAASTSRPSRPSGTSSSSSRPSRPSTASASQPSAPAKPGQKWEDFNPNRGTSKSNNPLLDRQVGGSSLRDRMKERENRGAMKNFNTNVDLKVDSPKSEDYSKAKPSNQTSVAYTAKSLIEDQKKKKNK